MSTNALPTTSNTSCGFPTTETIYLTKIKCEKCNLKTVYDGIPPYCLAPLNHYNFRCPRYKKDSRQSNRYTSQGNLYFLVVKCWSCGEFQKFKKGGACGFCGMPADSSWRKVGWGVGRFYEWRLMDLIGESVDWLDFEEVVVVPRSGEYSEELDRMRLKVRNCVEVL